MADAAFYDETGEFEDGPDPDDLPDLEEEGDGEEQEDAEGEEKPAARAVDWEKRAHDKEGQVARERSRRRAAERAAADLRSRIEALESQRGGDDDELAQLIAALRDDDDEPITDLAQIKRVLKGFSHREAEATKAEREQAKQQRQTEAIATSMADAEAEFALDHPDYFDAAKHYRVARSEELTDLGYGGERLRQKLAADLFGIVTQAMESGRDPAEVVYGLAKRRGFKAGAKEATRKLQQLQSGRAAATRPAGGGVAGQDLSWGDVAKLKGAAFDKAVAKLREREMRRK